jgi:hypothetical protein
MVAMVNVATASPLGSVVKTIGGSVATHIIIMAHLPLK